MSLLESFMDLETCLSVFRLPLLRLSNSSLVLFLFYRSLMSCGGGMMSDRMMSDIMLSDIVSLLSDIVSYCDMDDV